jgi:predicted glycogen debranching enzyme
VSSSITFGRDVLGNYERSKSKEWLVTNGLGGYASSTVIGANSRAYHGLLVAGLQPDLTRVLLLSKLEEELRTAEGSFSLSTNHYPGLLYPEGFRHLKGFELAPDPTWSYSVDGMTVRKVVSMPQGLNAVIVSYALEEGEGAAELTIKPLVNHRGFHGRTSEGNGLSFSQEFAGSAVRVDASAGPPSLYLKCDRGIYEGTGVWYRNMLYDEEEERGYPNAEDHFNPGLFRARLDVGETVTLTASVEAPEVVHDVPLPPPSTEGYSSRIEAPVALLAWLKLASRQFIVTPPGTDDLTVVAGYHWFGEFGRDAAVSVPGLFLATGRAESAKAVFRRFFKNQRGGLLPVLIDEGDRSWASVDTSLLFVYAVKKYWDRTKDTAFLKEVWGGLTSIMESYWKGTDFGIRMAEDGLIESRSEDLPVTWMDTAVRGAPTVRRLAKSVEVNALWYNALRSMEALGRAAGEPDQRYLAMAKKVKGSFNHEFWYEEGGYLLDSVDGERRDVSIRPNQVFAISLPFPVLAAQRWNRVLHVVEEHLYTPYGLRSLSPGDANYKGVYFGGPDQRDYAYHNGTAWSWLAGPYITAATKARSGPRDALVKKMLNAFLGHVADAGLGSISEIFDGNAPHLPRGAIAQAWSVAELLRTYDEDLRKAGATVA